jgi:hypothetical protein
LSAGLRLPHLARLAGDPATTPATRDAVEVTFQTLNRYLGVAVGKHLGYLFTGLWTALAGIALIQSDLLHPLFGSSGWGWRRCLCSGRWSSWDLRTRRLEAGRHPGPAGLYRLVGLAAGPRHRPAAHRLSWVRAGGEWSGV